MVSRGLVARSASYPRKRRHIPTFPGGDVPPAGDALRATFASAHLPGVAPAPRLQPPANHRERLRRTITRSARYRHPPTLCFRRTPYLPPTYPGLARSYPPPSFGAPPSSCAHATSLTRSARSRHTPTLATCRTPYLPTPAPTSGAPTRAPRVPATHRPHALLPTITHLHVHRPPTLASGAPPTRSARSLPPTLCAPPADTGHPPLASGAATRAPRVLAQASVEI